MHPSHVVAYAVSRHAPQPFRLREGGAAKATKATGQAVKAAGKAASRAVSATASRLHLQTPELSGVPESLAGYWRTLRETAVYKFTARVLFDARTVLRQTIWGDRLLVRVHGPTTLLLSSRGVRVAETLSRDQVNEIADTEAGVVPAAVERAEAAGASANAASKAASKAADGKADSTVDLHVAEVHRDGKVEFTDAKDLKEFVR